MIVTSRRAVATGAWAAVMLALAVTGPQWAFTPWFAAFALLLLAGLGAYALGLLDSHGGHHTAPRRTLAWDEPEYTPLAIEPPLENAPPWEAQRVHALPPHSPDWPMDATSPGTAIIDYAGESQSLGEEVQSIIDFYGLSPEEIAVGAAAYLRDEPPAVVVTDDPAGRHARPRVHAFTPAGAIARCQECQRQSHATADHDAWQAKYDASPPPATPAQKADTSPGSERLPDYIAAYLEEAGFTPHATRAALYESAFTKGMARATLAIEAARP
jgi:hypothetical protein